MDLLCRVMRGTASRGRAHRLFFCSSPVSESVIWDGKTIKKRCKVVLGHCSGLRWVINRTTDQEANQSMISLLAIVPLCGACRCWKSDKLYQHSWLVKFWISMAVTRGSTYVGDNLGLFGPMLRSFKNPPKKEAFAAFRSCILSPRSQSSVPGPSFVLLNLLFETDGG